MSGVLRQPGLERCVTFPPLLEPVFFGQLGGQNRNEVRGFAVASGSSVCKQPDLQINGSHSNRIAMTSAYRRHAEVRRARASGRPPLTGEFIPTLKSWLPSFSGCARGGCEMIKWIKTMEDYGARGCDSRALLCWRLHQK